VASRPPRNPIGWLLLGSGLATMLLTDAELYLVLDYRVGHGTLLLGRTAAFWVYALWPLAFLVGTPVLALFPDGRLSSRLSRWSMRVYLATSTLWLAGQVVGGIYAVAGQQVHVDATGSVMNSPAGLAATLSNLSWVFAAPIPVIWLIWVGHQVMNYRGASDQRREQVKWLTGGAAVLLIGLVVSLLVTDSGGHAAQAALIVSRLAIVAFPVTMGVAILKYRLYEIDRIISRTLAYAIVTGLLVGAYAGLALLATRVLSIPRWRWPPQRWPSRWCSILCGGESSERWTGGSTARGMTPTRWWPRSRRGCRTPPTWVRCRMPWPPSCNRPWNPPTC
jgi:hypothetical protein